MKRTAVILTMLAVSRYGSGYAMEPEQPAIPKPPAIKELTIIKPFFTSPKTIETLRAVIDKIQKKKLGYSDYAGITGIIWTDFWKVTQRRTEIVEDNKTVKVTLIDGVLKQHTPETFFNYPPLRNIFEKIVLPKMLSRIKRWTNQLPYSVFGQLHVQRCSDSEAMDWHQDPGEQYNKMAAYSLILLLSKQDDPVHGWEGGDFSIRPGLPTDQYDEADVTTLIPTYNQAILFNNKENSHAVSRIIGKISNQSQRDLLVTTIFFNDFPMPTLEAKKMIMALSNGTDRHK